jgi:hypothetical protein
MRRLLAGLAGLLPGPLGAQEVAWEGSLAVASGTYLFTERTTGWAMTNGIAATAGPLTLRVAWPVILQNSTLLTAAASTWIPSGGAYGSVVADSGAARGSRRGSGAQQPLEVPATAVTGYAAALGDPTAQIAMRIGAAGRSLTLRAAAKAPVADTASFGSGRWDFGAGASLAYALGSSAFLGADLSWWRLGDPPELDFRNPLFGSVSAGAVLAAGWAGLVSFSGGTSPLAGYDAPYSVGTSVSRLAGGAVVGLSTSVGLTETAPDVSVAMSWRVSF